MGKSYKKTPIIKDSNKGKKFAKNIANKRIRNLSIDEAAEVGSGKAYKKYYDSWLIADYVSRWTEQDAIIYYNEHCRPECYSFTHSSKEFGEQMAAEFLKDYPTVEDFLNWWRKIYIRK